MQEAVKIFSFGGGVQSTAVLLMHIKGIVEYDYFVFSDVGDDSENPDTIEYMDDFIYPLVKEHNIPFAIVGKTRFGIPDTVYKSVMRDNRSIPIPVKLPSGAYGNRSCTSDFKIVPVDRWIKQNYPGRKVDLSIGFSTDEMRRVEKKPEGYHSAHGRRKYGFEKRFVFPLVEHNMSRHDCHALIAEFGLPETPSSACWFCPFKSRQSWMELRRRRPDLYEESIKIEDFCNRKRGTLGKGAVSIHRDGFLKDIPEQSTMLDVFFDDLDGCDSGYCGL